MSERFNSRILILVLVVIALSVYAHLFASSSSESESRGIAIPFLTSIEIRNPEIALQYGVKGYLEITYPSGSPTGLAVNRGGEININILLHFVSYTPEVTEAQVNINPRGPWGLTIEQGDVNFNEFVSYNLSGDLVIKAGETVPVMMSVDIPENLSSSIEAIPLGDYGITSDAAIISELGGKKVAVH
jgi:hypothetical protein